MPSQKDPGEPEGTKSILQVVHEIPSTLRGHIDQSAAAQPGSQATSEAEGFRDEPACEELLEMIPPRIGMAMMAAGDAAETLARAMPLDPSVPRYATAGIARDALEAAAVGLWLLDPEIEPIDRVQRLVALTRNDLEEERKFNNAARKNHPEHEEVMKPAVEWVHKEREAFEALVDACPAKHRRIPSMTELSQDILDSEYEYRLFSGLSHAKPYALRYMTHMYGTSGDTAAVAWHHLVSTLVDSVCRLTWAYVMYLNPAELLGLAESLNGIYVGCGLREEPRMYFSTYLRQ